MTDLRESEKAKRLKAKYFADAVDNCGQAVGRQRDLTPEERADLTIRCTVKALDTLGVKSESCELEASKKWFLKRQAHDHCLVNNVASQPFDADRFVQQQANEMRTKPSGMSVSAAWFKMLPEEFQVYQAREEDETAAALREASRVLRDLASSGIPPSVCNALADPDVSPENVRKALHCLEEAQKALSAASYRKFLEVCTSDLPPTALTALGFTTESVAALPTARAALKKAQRALVAAGKQQFRNFCHALLPPAVRDALGFTPAATTPSSPPPFRARFADGDRPPPDVEAPQDARAGRGAGANPFTASGVGTALTAKEADTVKLQFDAANPVGEGAARTKVGGVGAFITQKFTLIPLEGPPNQLPVPEQFFVLFQKIVNQMIKLGMDDAALKQGLKAWRNKAEKDLQAIETNLGAAGVSSSGAPEGTEESDQADLEELEDIEESEEETEEAVAPKIGTDSAKLRQKWQKKQRQVHWLKGCYAYLNDLFAKEGLRAVKNFYTTLLRIPAFEKFRARCKTGAFKFLRATGPLHVVDRVWRAAAQFAYFSVREYRRLLRTLPTIITALGKLPDATVLLECGFPEQEDYEAVRRAVTVPGLSLKTGQLSKVSLGGWCRHVRNFVKRDLVATQAPTIERLIHSSSLAPTRQGFLEAWLAETLEKQLKAFLKTLSRRLAKRVKQVQYEHKKQEKDKRKGKSARPGTFGKGSLDKTVLSILGGRKIVGLAPATWKALVKPWRDATYTRLEARLMQVPVTKIVQGALAEAVRGLTPARLLARFWAPRPRYVTLADASWEAFQKFLEAGTISEAETQIAEDLRPQLHPVIQTSLSSFLAYLTDQKVRPPAFTKQTIPLGLVDTQMYEAPVLTAAGPRGMLKLLKKGPKARDPAVPILFSLHTPGRFRTFVDQHYSQGLGTPQRKGTKLILAIPFQRTARTPAAETSFQPEELPLGGSLDLGLKTLAVLHKAPVKHVEEGRWEEVKQNRKEKTPEQRAREQPLFIDQHYLQGTRSGWIAQQSSPKFNSDPADSPRVRNRKARQRRHKGIPMGFNWKRRLTLLQELARRRQAAMTKYRQEAKASGEKCSHKMAYWRLRREYKQAWQKVQDLHEDLACQLATRVIAACQQACLVVLRMEDLSWSHHAPKWKAGGFLTTWQVHWFFSRVQGHIIDLAPRIGLRVELVNARHTSTRCSHCGHEEKENRDRKRFQCRKCGFRLDADLNAARNILVAPLSNSPDAIASAGW